MYFSCSQVENSSCPVEFCCQDGNGDCSPKFLLCVVALDFRIQNFSFVFWFFFFLPSPAFPSGFVSELYDKVSTVRLFSCWLHYEVGIVTENTLATAFSHLVNEFVNYIVVLTTDAVCLKLNCEYFFLAYPPRKPQPCSLHTTQNKILWLIRMLHLISRKILPQTRTKISLKNNSMPNSSP